MRRLLVIATLATAAAFMGTETAFAKGCKGGKGCCSSCCYSYCGGCYSGCGYGCGYGGCGYAGCGWGYGGYCYAGDGMGAYYASAVDPSAATMVVSLPEDARLTIDDQKTVSTSSERAFVTRGLTPGKTYVYHLKASVVRDGRSVNVIKDVTVRAGQETKVSLELPETVVSR